MAQTIRTLPPDNLDVRTHVIEQCLPQLSLADLEAVGHAITHRWQELTAAQRRMALETHYAHLRALPAGTPLQVAVRNAPGFAYGDTVTIVRPLRPPSTNISVHDQHGKLWRFPMLWLISEVEDESSRTALRANLAAQGKADNS